MSSKIKTKDSSLEKKKNACICSICNLDNKDCKCESYNCKCIVYSIECIWPYCTCEKCLELNPMCECREEND